MYQNIVTTSTYRRYGQHQQSSQLIFALMLSMVAHILLLTELTNPVEKHDADLPHHVSLIEVELVASATASESKKPKVEYKQTKEKISVDAHPEKKHVVAKTPAIIHTHVPKQKNIIPIKHQQSEMKKSIPKQHPTMHKVVSQPNTSPAHQVINAATKTTKHLVTQTSLQQVNSGQIKKNYLAKIMQLIKDHKLYPYSARRRHMEGDVHISFSLDTSGHPSHIRVNGNHALLERASRQAIIDTQPFPPIPKAAGTSMRIEFTMQYSLLH